MGETGKQLDDGQSPIQEEYVRPLAGVLAGLERNSGSANTDDIRVIADVISQQTGQSSLNVLDEAELVRLIQQHVPSSVLRHADLIIKQMNPKQRDVAAAAFDVPNREGLQQMVFLPNHGKFIELVCATPLIAEMEKFVTSQRAAVHIDSRGVFDSKSWALSPEFNGGERKQREGYIAKMSGELDVVWDKLGWPGATAQKGHLNGMVFERGDIRTKLALKVLSDIFAGGWTYGSTLELGNRSVYDTGSFEIALADRLRYATAKWITMCEEDRLAWLAGKFTGSKEAQKGHYDLVRLASPNQYIG